MVPEAFSILTNGLTDSAAGVRDAASHGIGFCLTFESNNFAEPALPLLVRNLKDAVDYVRADAAVALMMFTQRQCQRGLPEPEYLIPPLMELLHDKYSFARFYAACALDCSCFGDKLKPWVPDIQKLLGDPDESVRQSGSNLLQIIDLSPSTNAVKSPGTAPALSVTTTGTSPIASEPADLREAKAHLAELREDYGEQHVEAQAALARVKELERLTKEEPNIPAELRAAKAHLAELRMEYGERYSEVRAALARIKALEENYRPSVVTNSSLTMPRKQ